jgi:glycosyltransferase involved in cell wall biosynthesis
VTDAGDGTLAIALLNPCFWPEVQRGSERLIRDLATDLIAARHRVHLVTSHPGLPSTVVEDGLEVTRNWRPPEKLLRWRGFQEHVAHVPASYATLRAGSYDLAQAFYPTDALAAIRWARRSRRPAVFHYGGIPQRAVLSSRRFRLRILSEAVRGADAVVVDSRAAAHGMRRWLGVEARVINPGVRLEAFQPVKGGGRRSDRPTIASAAAVDDPRKRVPLLLGAFRRVRREREDARLLLPRPASRQLAAELSAEDGVELFEQAPDAVARVFQEATVSALTSYNEAFGLVVVESLACGTPVVAARDGALPEILDGPEVGRLFDVPDEAHVAQALLECLDLAGAEGTAAACRRRAADFTAERCAEEHLLLYRELVARRAA